METEKEQQTPEKRTVCLQRADAEAFLAYRSVIARYAALLILLILVLAAALVAMRAHPSKFGAAAIVPAVLIPVAVFVSAVRKTENKRRQFAFFKKLSFRVEADVYDELEAQAKAFAPKERLAVGCVELVLLAAAAALIWNRSLNNGTMAILLAAAGLLLAPAAWAILTAKSRRILLQRGEFSAQNKASRGYALPFAILSGVLLAIAAAAARRAIPWAPIAAVGVFFALYLWRRLCLNRKYAHLTRLDPLVRFEGPAAADQSSTRPQGQLLSRRDELSD